METKFSYKKIFVLGLGFGVISLTWAIYDAYVPMILQSYLVDMPNVKYIDTTINAIMTFDNIFAISLIPFIGALSDKTWTRFGRRMPYLLVGIPIGALFFAAIPYIDFSFWALIVVILIMNFAMALFRGPTIALMPDLTPSHLRSKANGIVNFMGGVGAITFYGLFTKLFTENQGNIYAAFPVTGVIMIIVLLILLVSIRETKDQFIQSDKKSDGIFKTLISLFKEKKTSTYFLLGAIFLWFFGWHGITANFSRYGETIWNVSEDISSGYLMFFSATLIIMSIPSGIIASKFGRKKTILTGLIGMFLMLSVAQFIGADPMPMIVILLAIGGAFWALININSFPMVADMAPAAKLGLYTGLYYFSSQLAAIISPPIFGIVMDLTSRRAMFPMAALAFACALVMMIFVRRGEAQPQTKAS